MKKILILLVLISLSTISYGQDTLTTFILVRHAEKANDGTNNPGLTAEGQERANRLNELLKAAEIAAIYSTPFKRTMKTVEPLSLEKGLDIIEYNPRGQDFISEMYNNNKGKTVVVSGHSNTTPFVVNLLIGSKKYEMLSEDEYDKIFVVTISEIGKGTVTVMSY